ncbi:hypothetical protein GpartN1_g6522.t1 [Galdieria partita]|uniref:E2F/DP family winged-helix DNA-binding domain-containing protein n=1 Tax=Galdieria partita TaxID=83374 RepID=A0A9C7Q3E1_9RHOD|nr:hypothetical protein GpartN1_g6522.t1 [Galdieria partita]
MADKFLGGTDRKSQLFFPENFKTKKVNGKGYIDFHSYGSHNILEEFLDTPIALSDGSRHPWTDFSEYSTSENSMKLYKSLDDTELPYYRFEQCQKFQDHLCNFASATALNDVPSSPERTSSRVMDNERQEASEELENGENLRYPRKEGTRQSSLFDLTARFFDILLHSPNGTVDLNFASRKLDVRKRRLYDVVNVCEGVGILDKATKNCVKLRENGAESLANMHKFLSLQRQLKMLEEEENDIDRELQTHNKTEHRLKRNRPSCRLSMLFSNSYNKELLIEAPAGSVLSVLKPKLSNDGIEWLYQIAVKSSGGQVAYRILSDFDRVQQEPHSSSKQSRKTFNLTKYWPCETVSMSTK